MALEGIDARVSCQAVIQVKRTVSILQARFPGAQSGWRPSIDWTVQILVMRPSVGHHPAISQEPKLSDHNNNNNHQRHNDDTNSHENKYDHNNDDSNHNDNPKNTTRSRAKQSVMTQHNNQVRAESLGAGIGGRIWSDWISRG